MRRVARPVFFALILFLLLPFLYSVASAGDNACQARNNNTFDKLLACVTLESVRQHQAVLQAIADANEGRRAAGTPGHEQSAAYVTERLEAAGYQVSWQPFTYYAWRNVGPTVLEQVVPEPTTYATGTDYVLMRYSGSGDVTAPVTPVDVQLGLGNSSTSGCEATDFVDFPAGHIALIQRGTCIFREKAENADDAGAAGILIFNQGDRPGRMAVSGGTLTAGFAAEIPVLAIGYDLGRQLAQTPNLVLRLSANVIKSPRESFNVLADSANGDPDNVVIVGAHLDSVWQSPGIQDNGSGSAAILEVALQMHKVKPRNQLRFAWWGAEELGLVGSTAYVDDLATEERQQIALYLNFDMIASPNYVRYIYDGDGSAFGLAGPPGSAEIESLFEQFYAGRGLPSEPTPLDYRSDYVAFFEAGIPFGGLFTGAEGVKTPEQAAIYGGTAGQRYDPCYHRACDTFDNVSLEALDLNADAVAYATLQYAMNTLAINGQQGKGNFRPPIIEPEPGDLPAG